MRITKTGKCIEFELTQKALHIVVSLFVSLNESNKVDYSMACTPSPDGLDCITELLSEFEKSSDNPVVLKLKYKDWSMYESFLYYAVVTMSDLEELVPKLEDRALLEWICDQNSIWVENNLRHG